jgi:site-specific DNA recombinase
MKRAIRYLRFSNLGQSNGSIERQELYTDQWLTYNKVELVDSFIDRGKSARTFDRPDFIKLQDFIAKHHKHVDYLLVDQMDRFSRDAGEAMTLVKALQKRYSIQVVSVTEGITFDYDTPGSFFRAGLQLLLAEEDNINRSIKIRGGNYTARAKEGRFLSNLAPFGYRKSGEGKQRGIVIEEKDAVIVRFIFDAFLRSVPLVEIKKKAKDMGFNRKGSTAIEKMIKNPVYAGLVHAKAFKEHPGGLFPGVHEPLISKLTWDLAQSKFKAPEKARVIINDVLPMRAVLKCHCGQPLTGSASRGRHGGRFYYYRCKISGHNNFNANRAHEQFLQACELMSLSAGQVKKIRDGAEEAIQREMAVNNRQIGIKKVELEKIQEKLFAVEEKWISDQIGRDTYDRWVGNYNNELTVVKSAIARLGRDLSAGFDILHKHLNKLTDIRYFYENADTLEKREFLNVGFDCNLYYRDGVYRTPTMIETLAHKALKMREKNLLIYEKKGDILMNIPSGGAGGIRTLVQTWYKVSFLHT